MNIKNKALSLGLTALFLLPSCATRPLTNAGVREALSKGPGLELKKEEVAILDVSEVGNYAVVKARITTALKYEQVGHRWVLKEIRLGDRRWEDVEMIRRVLEQERAERARQWLRLIEAALEKYRQAHGQYPNASTYEVLIDQLSPQYLPEVIRIDPWSRPFKYHYLSPSAYRLLSVGADGKEGTDDDISIQK
ncbi:MAG: type II secretion system protein GspG [Acidobacteria bacterium]|nr:type II secretion system protein GspG [Acidobacteriota bacterium]MBI3655156.1 type II secretion system protein GspG [Acidobacteriota bacterium]